MFKSIAQPTAVECGDLHFDGETTIVCVCSGRYYGGGFMQSMRSMAAWGPWDSASRSVKRALFSLPNIFRKSLPVPVGTLVTAAFSYEQGPLH